MGQGYNHGRGVIEKTIQKKIQRKTNGKEKYYL